MTSEAASQEMSLIEQVQAELEKGTGDLPVLPKAAADALRLAQVPEVNFDHVVRAAEKDPPLAARILAVANSAFYSRGVAIASLHQALVRLGVQATRDVLYMAVYGATVFEVPKYREKVSAIFTRGCIAARVARAISKEQNSDGDMAFLAGLLYDVGRARCLKLVAAKHRRASVEDVEMVVEELHGHAGAALVAAWKLPQEIGDACIYHDEPEDRPLAALIGVADKVVRAALDGEFDETALIEVVTSIGLQESSAAGLMALAQDT